MSLPAGLLIFVALALLAALSIVIKRLRAARRAEFIRQYTLPRGLFEQLRKRRPQLTQKDCQLVAQALRQFFLAYLAGGRQYVSMPSQVADELWHEFIVFTKNYEAFCQRAFGHFLHHTPAVALGSALPSNAGLRRCWWQCCRAENIDPRHPLRLPLLFALDAKLNIEGGFRYAPDCGPLRQRQAVDDGGGSTVIHCGGDFSDRSFDGGADGFGSDGSGDGGDAGASGDGGGDGGGGGGGDGGGCGGGGGE